MSIKSLLLFFGIMTLSLQSVQCFDEEAMGKMKNLFEPVFKECATKFDITKEQLHAARESKDLSSIDSCFFACLYKHKGLINDKGMFDKDAAIAAANKFFSGEHATAATQVAENCNSVNDASVSDGDAGCERAKLLFECIVKNKDLFTK